MRILVCVAGRPDDQLPVRAAGIIARITQSPLTLVHVVGREEDRAAGERTVASLRDALPGQRVETRVRVGAPPAEILAAAEAGDYDLVVVGAHEPTGLKEHLLGSVTAQTIRQAPISVLVAREVRPSLKRILICTGGTDVADKAVETGAWLAQAADARASLLHVVTPVASMYTGLGEIDEGLSELLQTETPVARHLRHGAEILDGRQVDAELKLRYGVAADEIVREAREGDYDLIMMGVAEKEARLSRWALGNVTREVVAKAPRSVLVVKQALVPDNAA